MPSISVITPVYNAGELLRETWDSLRRQTYQSFEWILVDDGSDDLTKSIIREIDLSGSLNVKTCYLEQGGACRARNKGLSIACGQAVKFLDADDLLEPNLLMIQNQLMLKNPGAIICSPVKQVKRKAGGLQEIKRNVLYVVPDDLFGAHLEQPIVHHSALLIPKELVEEVGGYDQSLLADQDGDFVQRLFWLRPRFLYNSEASFLFRQHSETDRISGSQTPGKVSSRYAVFCKLRKMVEEAGLLDKYRKPLSQKLLGIALRAAEANMTVASSYLEEALILNTKLRYHHNLLLHHLIKQVGFVRGCRYLHKIRNLIK